MKRYYAALCSLALIFALILLFQWGHKEDSLQAPVSHKILPIQEPASPIKNAPNQANRGSLLEKISSQAALMDRPMVRLEEQEAGLEEMARELNVADGPELLRLSLNEKRKNNERFLAVYLMGKRGSDFRAELAMIAGSKHPLLLSQPEPHTLGELQKNFEVSLRIEALKGLDLQSPGSIGNELSSIFQDVWENSPSANLKQLARIAYVGSVKKENLLNQYIEAKLQAVIK